MKILYGIQGTGNGHITRARILCNAFAQRNDVHVDYLFSGRAADQYFDMQVFGEYKTYQGLSFVVKQGRVAPLATLKAANLYQAIKDIQRLDVSNYDLVLNDFEPISAWAAARQKVPSISISHQAAFNLAVPKEGHNAVNKIITRYFAPTKYSLGVHWHHFGQHIIPPFVDPIMINGSVRKPNAKHTLVYLPFESTDDIFMALNAISDVTFKCFHPSVETYHKQKNIEWYPPSKQEFQQTLIACQSVIANAGFELATECLSLGKPILMKPLQGQYEQLSNAKTLRELGLSQTIYELDTESIDDWLSKAKACSISFPSDPTQFVDWLIQGRWDQTRQICETLWRQVDFPISVQQKLAALKLLNN